MPHALTFPLHPDQAHALFCQWLALGDYSLSTQVHDQSGYVLSAADWIREQANA